MAEQVIQSMDGGAGIPTTAISLPMVNGHSVHADVMLREFDIVDSLLDSDNVEWEFRPRVVLNGILHDFLMRLPNNSALSNVHQMASQESTKWFRKHKIENYCIWLVFRLCQFNPTNKNLDFWKGGFHVNVLHNSDMFIRLKVINGA
ncbi:hypothetical protein ACH5RR_026101 [Cinchona calisaya]|uniref:Uncharacterized protein n=1 Tax=Cinchona calisaya TaxID=153742 RepID=A0ABD2Z3S9_9GENT